LRKASFEEFAFNNDGSSHQFWSKKEALLPIIQYGHINTLDLSIHAEQVVVVLPCQEHRLDYYNNHLFKHQQGHLIEYISSHFSQDQADHKLRTQWNYLSGFDHNVPRWIMREWCSFWISDVLNESYDSTKYSKLKFTASLDTQDIFDNYIVTFQDIVSKLGLTITVDISIIHNQHCEFLNLQKFHNSQVRCQQYVRDLLAEESGTMIVQSIFDEAYLQHLLRQNYIEIQCDGLDEFPSTVQQLRTITYETSNNRN